MSDVKLREMDLRENIAEPWEWLKQQIIVTFRTAVCITLDAILFCIWLLIAWGCDVLSVFIAAKGFHEGCAEAFKWLSSISTLILTVTYIICDIIVAFRHLWFNLKSQQKGE
jgi:hypothetical protein